MKLFFSTFCLLALICTARAQESTHFRIAVALDSDPSGIVGRGEGRLTGNRFLCTVETWHEFRIAKLLGPAEPGTNVAPVFDLLGGCAEFCDYGGEFDLTNQQVDQLRAGLWSVQFDGGHGQIAFDRVSRFSATNDIQFTANLDGDNWPDRPRRNVRFGRATFGLTGNTLSYEIRLPANFAPYSLGIDHYGLLHLPTGGSPPIAQIGTVDCGELSLSNPPPDAEDLELLPACVVRGATWVNDWNISPLLIGDGILRAWTLNRGSAGGQILPVDSDHDGVPDYLDQCPNTPTNTVVNTNGCSIAQLCPCDGPWKSHGHYVMRIRTVTTRFVRAGLITGRQQRAIIHRAVHSECGRRR